MDKDKAARYQIVYGSFQGQPVGKPYTRRAYAFKRAQYLNQDAATKGNRANPYGVLITWPVEEPQTNL